MKGAAALAGQLAVEGAVPTLISLLSRDPYIAEEATVALGTLGATSAEQALIEAFEERPDPELEVVIVRALADIGGPRSLRALRRILDEGRLTHQASISLAKKAFDTIAARHKLPEDREADGRLSIAVANAEEGKLSVTAEAGALSWEEAPGEAPAEDEGAT